MARTKYVLLRFNQYVVNWMIWKRRNVTSTLSQLSCRHIILPWSSRERFKVNFIDSVLTIIRSMAIFIIDLCSCYDKLFVHLWPDTTFLALKSPNSYRHARLKYIQIVIINVQQECDLNSFTTTLTYYQY